MKQKKSVIHCCSLYTDVVLFLISFRPSFFSKTLVSTRLKRARENSQPGMNFNISKLV